MKLVTWLRQLEFLHCFQQRWGIVLLSSDLSGELSLKISFLLFRGNLLCMSFCPLPLVLSLYTTEKSLTQLVLHPPFRNLYGLIRFLLGLLFRSNGPSFLSLSSQLCSRPLVTLVAHLRILCSMSLFPLYWEPRTSSQEVLYQKVVMVERKTGICHNEHIFGSEVRRNTMVPYLQPNHIRYFYFTRKSWLPVMW